MRLNYNPSPYTRTHPDCPTLPYIDGQRGGHRLDERRSSARNCISSPVAPALADGQTHADQAKQTDAKSYDFFYKPQDLVALYHQRESVTMLHTTDLT
ncbi:hypothetical protein Q7C36_014143 [Tachysurus vachellii]|uniref:Uncharacterized protein n=1 Tax=Tachysurus vachellii TaxID=175792 RepID=A0AA88MH72_TACVA|nr:hypothetical protein Q7C36_014143 [Tachysurus vachellii]